MNKDDQEFFRAIKKGSNEEVLLLPNKPCDAFLKSISHTCLQDYGFIPKSLITFPLGGKYKNFVLVVCYKNITEYSKKSEMNARRIIMNKIEKMVEILDNASKCPARDNFIEEKREGYIPYIKSGIYCKKIFKPILDFLKCYSDRKGMYDKIRKLLKAIRAAKNYYYGNINEVFSKSALEASVKHEEFMNELLKSGEKLTRSWEIKK